MKLVVLFTLLAVVSCEKKTDSETKEKENEAQVIQVSDGKEIKAEEKKLDTPQTKKVEKALDFVKLKYDSKDRPSSVKFPGKAKHGVRWQDRNGDNWFIFSSTRAMQNGKLQVENLYGTHVAILDGEVKTLRSVKELKTECEDDWNASFEQRAVSILDLDKDGYGELSFGYRVTCTSDVSPNTYKLMVLENGEKHILRGSDIIDMGSEVIGDGEYKMEGFKGEKVLLEHLKKVWKNTVKVKL